MAKKKIEKSFEQMLKEALIKEDEQPYAVPGNWDFVRLGKIVQINPPRYKPEMDDAELCSFVPMKAVSDKFGIIDNIETKPFGKIKNGYTSFKENDVLFAKITPCMENGKAAIARNLINGFGYGTTEFFVLRCSNMVSNMFLYYLVRSQSFRDSAKPNMTGTVGQRRVPKAYLDNYKFPIPPLLEQKRIVQKLSSMLGKLKEARELIVEAKETFEERRAAILNKAFTGELTKKWREENPDVESAAINLHKSFESVKNQYERVCLDCKSKGIGKPKRPEIIKYFNQNKIKDLGDKGLNGWCETDFVNFCILQRGFDLPTTKRIIGKYPVVSSSGIIDYHIESKVKGPGFTVGRSGSVGKTFYVEEDYWPLNTTLFSKELIGNDPRYAFYYLSAFDFLKYSSSTAVPTLNRNNFSDALIKVPPVIEQKEIVRILDKLLEHEDEAKALIDMQEQIDLLEKSMLSKAFRGELGTNNPNDEPAIELLKRSLKNKVSVSQSR